jgi:hypothetical protein
MRGANERMCPTPETHYHTHQKPGKWTSLRWQELIAHVPTDEETRRAYYRPCLICRSAIA